MKKAVLITSTAVTKLAKPNFVLYDFNLYCSLCTESKINLLAINETKLDATINDYEIHLPDFEVLRRDRLISGRNGGGVCIYLPNSINYNIRDDLCDEQLECLAVEISKQHSRPLQ